MKNLKKHLIKMLLDLNIEDDITYDILSQRIHNADSFTELDDIHIYLIGLYENQVS